MALRCIATVYQHAMSLHHWFCNNRRTATIYNYRCMIISKRSTQITTEHAAEKTTAPSATTAMRVMIIMNHRVA